MGKFEKGFNVGLRVNARIKVEIPRRMSDIKRWVFTICMFNAPVTTFLTTAWVKR
jgi:hypothetical protein